MGDRFIIRFELPLAYGIQPEDSSVDRIKSGDSREQPEVCQGEAVASKEAAGLEPVLEAIQGVKELSLRVWEAEVSKEWHSYQASNSGSCPKVLIGVTAQNDPPESNLPEPRHMPFG